LPGSPIPRYVFLSLLPDPASQQAVAILQAALDPAAESAVVPAPVRGLMFFSARGAVARELDGWWERNVPGDARPVILVMDEPGLEAHLGGLDSEVVVGIRSEAERARYARHPHAHVVVTEDPVALAEEAIATFPAFARAPEVPPAPPAGTGPSTIFMPRLHAGAPARVAPERPPDRSLTSALPDPFTELSSVGPLPPPDGRADPLSRASLFSDHAGRGSASPEPGSPFGFLGRLLVRRHRIVIPREIGDLVLGMHPPPLVVVPARKGGVGKTVTAGAVAQVIGYSLGDTTGTAAIVDQNIGNPDQWGRLDIPATAGTVRQLMAALSSGMELPPTPAWAKTPALGVYPEDRATADAYPPGLIQRFVQHLRERHVFLVVDLPNRLPDYTTAEAAICAAYIDLADLVILPTTDDPSALMGVLEYLETPSMRGKLVMVSYIVSTDRQLRSHHVVTELLDEIRKRVVAIETVPKSEKATLGIVKGVSILDISPKLRDAYIRVTRTAVRALATAG
jgi:cellulose biosynthesis protein BcsQ